MASPHIKLLTWGEHGVYLTSTFIQVGYLTLHAPGPSLPKEKLFFPNECIQSLHIFSKPEEVQFESGY